MRMLKRSVTRQVLLCLLLALAAVFFLINSTRAAFAVGLKQNSVITGETITLGDIFYNLPEGGEKVLGPAPIPGSEMTLNARTLLRIAVAMDLPWRPQTSAETVTLTRAATVIENTVIEADIEEALREKGLEGPFNLLFNGGEPRMILPANEQPNFEITNVTYDASRDQFSAVITAPSSENPIQRMQVSGQIERMVQIPVPRDNIRNGMHIGKRDIDFIEIRQRDLQPDMVTKEEDLASMTPRRMLLAGKPVKFNEIEAPRIVERGESVTLVFKEGALMLTSKGRALENGAKGDLIRVVNASSSRTVEGIVTAEQEVTVQSY
jgi:flagella basal body P-ring formation protein FlgA